MRGVCENASEGESDKMEVGAEMARRELASSSSSSPPLLQLC